ncbi:putative 3prime [Diplonema papillatum]|nr:putative 3prime [Diplonema papillatum]KAJ9462231.1 putative 3prime [Diplonema papillatum]
MSVEKRYTKSIADLVCAAKEAVRGVKGAIGDVEANVFSCHSDLNTLFDRAGIAKASLQRRSEKLSKTNNLAPKLDGAYTSFVAHLMFASKKSNGDDSSRPFGTMRNSWNRASRAWTPTAVNGQRTARDSSVSQPSEYIVTSLDLAAEAVDLSPMASRFTGVAALQTSSPSVRAERLSAIATRRDSEHNPPLVSFDTARTRLQDHSSALFVAQLDSWDFIVSDCSPAIGLSRPDKQQLVDICLAIFSQYTLWDAFSMSVPLLEDFFTEVAHGYLDLPYHSFQHAVDVLQCAHVVLKCLGLANWLSDFQIFATLLSAVCHDFGHPGIDNKTVLTLHTKLANFFCRDSVLERYHVAAAWPLVEQHFSFLPQETLDEICAVFIKCILGTDVTKQFDHLNNLEARPDVELLLQLVVHLCDLSNATKRNSIYLHWTRNVTVEFWLQGDLQRKVGLQPSPFCDVDNTDMRKLGVNFIKLFVAPLVVALGEYLDIQEQVDNLNRNYNAWSEALAEEQTILAKQAHTQWSTDHAVPSSPKSFKAECVKKLEPILQTIVSALDSHSGDLHEVEADEAQTRAAVTAEETDRRLGLISLLTAAAVRCAPPSVSTSASCPTKQRQPRPVAEAFKKRSSLSLLGEPSPPPEPLAGTRNTRVGNLILQGPALAPCCPQPPPAPPHVPGTRRFSQKRRSSAAAVVVGFRDPTIASFKETVARRYAASMARGPGRSAHSNAHRLPAQPIGGQPGRL